MRPTRRLGDPKSASSDLGVTVHPNPVALTAGWWITGPAVFTWCSGDGDWAGCLPRLYLLADLWALGPTIKTRSGDVFICSDKHKVPRTGFVIGLQG